VWESQFHPVHAISHLCRAKRLKIIPLSNLNTCVYTAHILDGILAFHSEAEYGLVT